MTDWITDMDLAPRKSEWVLAAVPIDETNPTGETVAEVVIFDGGMWTNTGGYVVNPVAWAKITPFQPRAQHRYEWEADPNLIDFLDAVSEHIPSGYGLIGLAVGHYENGEGALILVDEKVDPENEIWNADVLKDIAGDGAHHYQTAINALNAKMMKH